MLTRKKLKKRGSAMFKIYTVLIVLSCLSMIAFSSLIDIEEKILHNDQLLTKLEQKIERFN